MHFTAFGLIIASELPLGILSESSGEPDILIRIEKLAPMPFVTRDGWQHQLYQVDNDVFLAWNEVAVFRLRPNEIVIDPRPNVSDDLLRLFVLGPVMGVLLEKRDYLTLHASCVAVDTAAIAFLGQKGRGKSTMGAAFVKQGFAMITDDILALNTSIDGVPMAIPGFPQLKLWPDTAAAVGETHETVRPLVPDSEKLGRSTAGTFQRSPLPLRHVFFLEYGRDVSLQKLRGSIILTRLLSQTYGYRFLDADHIGTPEFVRWARLASHVNAYRLVRPLDLQSLDEHVNLIVETVLAAE